ncbi:hypothetical protein AHAS_Ahas02G0254200 [Arachis hypogaea]
MSSSAITAPMSNVLHCLSLAFLLAVMLSGECSRFVVPRLHLSLVSLPWLFVS